MEIYTKKRIFRGEYWEVQDYREAKISVCRHVQEKCTGDVSDGNTGRISGDEMENKSNRKSSTFTPGWMDTKSKKCQRYGGRGEAVK